MTIRGWGTLLVGTACLLVGTSRNIAYLTVFGAAALTLVGLGLLSHGPRHRVTLQSADSRRRVVRGQPAAMTLTVTGSYRPGHVRLVDGEPRNPSRSVALPRPQPGESTTMRLDLATAQRGQYPLGPYKVVQGDPWGLTRSTLAADPGGLLTVIPRVLRLSADMRRRLGLDSPTRGNRRGEGQFFALREYVLGDEPRLVHWRSSARAGKLIVRQDVAPTSIGSLILLDVDASAYDVEGRLAGEFDAERFESAVEAAASIAVAQGRDLEVAHLATTEQMVSLAMASAGMAEGLLDALAIVRPAPPTDNSPERLHGLLQSLKVSRLVVVTGTPSPALLAAVDRVSGSLSVAVVRVGSTAPIRIQRVSVLDISRVEDVA